MSDLFYDQLENLFDFSRTDNFIIFKVKVHIADKQVDMQLKYLF